MKDLKDDFRGKIKLELQGLFEQYLSHPNGSSSAEDSLDKGKGILGGPPPRFPPKETLPTSSGGFGKSESFSSIGQY